MHLSYVSCAWVSGDWVWNSCSVSHQVCEAWRKDRHSLFKVQTAAIFCTQIQDVCSDGVYEKAWELAM